MELIPTQLVIHLIWLILQQIRLQTHGNEMLILALQ